MEMPGADLHRRGGVVERDVGSPHGGHPSHPPPLGDLGHLPSLRLLPRRKLEKAEAVHCAATRRITATARDAAVSSHGRNTSTTR